MDVYVDADEFEALEALLHSAERRLGEYSITNRNSCVHAEHAVLHHLPVLTKVALQ
jgi:hypothetical protein